MADRTFTLWRAGGPGGGTAEEQIGECVLHQAGDEPSDGDQVDCTTPGLGQWSTPWSDLEAALDGGPLGGFTLTMRWLDEEPAPEG